MLQGNMFKTLLFLSESTDDANAVETTKLHSQENGSDKLYFVALVKSGDKYIVTTEHGKRGAPLKLSTKTPEPVSLEQAKKLYGSYVSSKRKDGYKDYDPNTPMPTKAKYYIIEAYGWGDGAGILAFYTSDAQFKRNIEALCDQVTEAEGSKWEYDTERDHAELKQKVSSMTAAQLVKSFNQDYLRDELSLRGGDGSIYLYEKTGTVEQLTAKLTKDLGGDDEEEDGYGPRFETVLVDQDLTNDQRFFILNAEGK